MKKQVFSKGDIVRTTNGDILLIDMDRWENRYKDEDAELIGFSLEKHQEILKLNAELDALINKYIAAKQIQALLGER